jgi:hypothetical protein
VRKQPGSGRLAGSCCSVLNQCWKI